MVKIYPYAPRNVDWYFKRFLAGDYKKFISIIKQVYSDAVDRGNIIRLPNDNENRYRFKDKPAGLLKYYDYINELVDSLKSNPNDYNRLDLVDMFFSVCSQNMFLNCLGYDYYILDQVIGDKFARVDKRLKTQISLLYSFLYGHFENDGPVYDPTTQTIHVINNNHISSIKGDEKDMGFKLVTLDVNFNLETKVLNLDVTYNKPFVFYKNGVYIGETENKFENKGREQVFTIIANGQGIFYIYDYKIEGDYPTAKIYGTFENGSLKNGASVGVEFYKSMEDFNAKTFLNDGEKAGGVMAALDRQQYNGTVFIPDDIQLDDIDYEYLLLINNKTPLLPLESEDLFDPNGYFMKYKIGPYYTTDQAKHETNPFKVSDIMDLPTDFNQQFHKVLIHNLENSSPLSVKIESKKGKTPCDILGFMFFPVVVSIIEKTPFSKFFTGYFDDKVYKDIARGQAFTINKDGVEYKETGRYWNNYDNNRLDNYKVWLHEKLLDTTFTTEIERENYINAIFYASQQYMDILFNYFNDQRSPYQPVGEEFINVFYTDRKTISIGRKYNLAMSGIYHLFDDYTSKFNTPMCGSLTATVEYNLKEGFCNFLFTPFLETYYKGGKSIKYGGKYIGEKQKVANGQTQNVSNDETELEMENFIPNGKGKMYFYLVDKKNYGELMLFSDNQLVMTLETDRWSNGDLLKGTRVTINYIDNQGQNPKYKGRVFNIKLSKTFLLNHIIYDGLNEIESEIEKYELKIPKLAKITQERADVKAVENAVKTENYLRSDNRLGSKSHQGIVLFDTETTTPDTNYVYIGPILPNSDKTVSISKKYGKILRFSKEPNVNVSDKKYTVFIKPGKENSRDWDKFVLKPNFSKNYSNTEELPLQWSIVRFGSVFDNFKFSLTNNSLGQKDIASELVTRVFRDLMVDPIANDLSLTKGLFKDTQRVFKMEKMIYIQVLIYFKILFVLLKRYDSNLISLPGYVSIKPLLNKLYEDYDSFTQFNEEVSDDYKYTDGTTTDNIDEELNSAPVSTLLSPIISSMDPKTNTSVFEPINQNIDDPKQLPVYVLKAALLVLQNLGIVLQMYISR